jgi:hypothetical protein
MDITDRALIAPRAALVDRAWGIEQAEFAHNAACSGAPERAGAPRTPAAAKVARESPMASTAGRTLMTAEPKSRTTGGRASGCSGSASAGAASSAILRAAMSGKGVLYGCCRPASARLASGVWRLG